MRINQAVILIGGKGTRLGALTQNFAKPMLEVGGRPFVEHTIAHLARFGVREVIMLAGHAGALPHERYHGRTMFGAEVSVLVEPEPLGTGGALTFAGSRLDAQFLLTNGDTYFQADLLPLFALAADPKWSAAMLLRRIEDAARYGRVDLADGSVIRGFHEKSADPDRREALVNAGTYIMRRDRVMPAIGKPPCSLEDFLFPRLAAEGALGGVEADGYFVDIGIPSSLEGARGEIVARRTRPAAFLDRDGTINVDNGYTHKPDDLVFVPGAVEAVKRLNAAGYYVIVVTNQAGIARGLYTEADMRRFHLHMQEKMMEQGAHIDAFYHCPHHPDGKVDGLAIACDCRKPAVGMLEQAAAEWPIDRARSFMIGDKDDDVAAARAFGIPGAKVDAAHLTLDAVASFLNQDASRR